jgi:DNA methyltransferase 1-associated protein 1
MADIKDILGLSRDPAREGMAAPRVKKVQMKKPEGMSREVFALLQQDAEAGRTSVPIAPTGRTDGLLKEKRSRMVGWEWQGFNNGGRTDGLRLSHWKKNNDKSTDYTFARFNKTVRVLSYTEDEYARHLVHPAWNKAESDQLFDLCRRFDLRWPVIHDRFVSATPKPMEQLKERYYDMCNHLLCARAEAGEAEAAGHPLLKYKFDPRQERERKAEFERLYHRSAQEVRDEVQRLEQAKALEAKLKLQKKMAKPGGRASGLAALRASLSAQASRQ